MVLMNKAFWYLVLTLFFLLSLTSCEVTPNYSLLKEKSQFTMQEFCSVDCDSFFVIPPYASKELDSLMQELQEKDWKALSRASETDRTASILFVKAHRLAGYAIVNGVKADFREFPAGKGFPMTQRLEAQIGKVDKWIHVYLK